MWKFFKRQRKNLCVMGAILIILIGLAIFLHFYKKETSNQTVILDYAQQIHLTAINYQCQYV